MPKLNAINRRLQEWEDRAQFLLERHMLTREAWVYEEYRFAEAMCRRLRQKLEDERNASSFGKSFMDTLGRWRRHAGNVGHFAAAQMKHHGKKLLYVLGLILAQRMAIVASVTAIVGVAIHYHAHNLGAEDVRSLLDSCFGIVAATAGVITAYGAYGDHKARSNEDNSNPDR